MDGMDVTRSRKPMCRSFWRLAVMIKLILRVFTPKFIFVQQQESSAAALPSSVKKPTMLELSTVNNKRKLSERIQQRLLTKPAALAVNPEATMMTSSVLSNEVQNVLINPPWHRSSQLLDKALQELQTCCQSFNDFPIAIQKSICKLGWYQLVEPTRVIYTAGYDPICYYMLLSGTVIEVDQSGTIGNTIHYVGSSFGDAAIIDGSCRTTNCYAKDPVELLVISRSDYIDLSLRQARKSYQNSKHFTFCKTVSILKQWPLDELSIENCSQCFYKPGAVIVKDSKKSDNIYVVMSGSCHVVKRFIDNSSLQNKTHKSLNGEAAAASPLSTQVHSLNRKMDGEERDNDELNLRKLRDRRASYPNIQEENDLDKAKGKPILIQLLILHPKDIFGLSTILYEDEPSISLVSNGCECVLIAKSFILAHMVERMRTWLYKQVQQFPSQEMMLKRIRDHQSWNIYKQTLVSHLKKKHT